MDFQSAMETFAEAWVAANSKGCPLSDLSVQSQALPLTRNCKSPSNVDPTIASHSRCESRDTHLDATHTPAPSMSVTAHVDTESMVSPPSMKDGFDKSSSGKSLPVHCVVESVCTLEEPKISQAHQWRRRPVVETDSFVIIPINTPFQELVQAALHRLGYPSDSVASARGSLVMKNWKPLTFDQITDDTVITVGDILSELTTVATLRIQMYRPRPNVFIDIKDKLFKLLLVQSQGRLLSMGCPLDEVILSHICRGDSSTTNTQHFPEPTEDCRRKFDQWWATQMNTQHVHSALYNIVQANKSLERPTSLSALQDHVHPVMQTVQNQYPTQKTRMRTSFDPELELPKLQRWFTDNQHPTRQQIQQYVKELNSLESRRGRKPLDVNNVVYWFKNARAAQKRAEVRNMSPGIPCHLSVNGYNSGSHSPPNGSALMLVGDRYGQLKSPPSSNYDRNPHVNLMSEEMSMPDSEIEDEEATDGHQRTDDEQPPSPSMPLSLTINRKSESHNTSPSPLTPRSDQQSMLEPKIEPVDEPVNLHSPSDLSNNNKMKNHTTDVDKDTNERETEGEKHSPEADLIEIANRPPLHRLGSPTSDQENSPYIPRGGAPGPDNLDRLAAGFPLVPNSMFSHSIMYMSHYIPGLTHGHSNMSATPPSSSSGLSMSALAASSADERRKRNRTFIDPVTEVPRLEQWFSLNTHPSHSLILKYTEELNCMTYRQKFPRLEPKNVQFWFKNRRAKCKRLKMSLYDSQAPPGQYHHDRE